MSTPLRVAAFVAALAAAFALALGVGDALGPDRAPRPSPTRARPPTVTHAGEHVDGSDGRRRWADGLAADGYTLDLADARTLGEGRTGSTSRSSPEPDGAAVTAYDVEHERDLHLIAVRRDLTGFQHVHPVLDPATGTWSTEVRLTPGVWRVFADFTPEGGDAITLADDVAVAGDYTPAEQPGESAPPRSDR